MNNSNHLFLVDIKFDILHVTNYNINKRLQLKHIMKTINPIKNQTIEYDTILASSNNEYGSLHGCLESNHVFLFWYPCHRYPPHLVLILDICFLHGTNTKLSFYA